MHLLPLFRRLTAVSAEGCRFESGSSLKKDNFKIFLLSCFRTDELDTSRWHQISPGRLVHKPIICPTTPNSHLDPSLLDSEPETRASGLALPTHRVDSPTASPLKQDSLGCAHPSNLDAADIDDPLMAAEYVADIQRYLRQAEDTTLLSRLPARSDLVHASVHTASGLSETLFLCANLTDRFLSTRLVSPARCVSYLPLPYLPVSPPTLA
ncbi:hypothetical protein B0H13DRAFT_2651937 [Mycena leptocephala]|nr:hypothetical protein B0H13DRAFT_2651937 [Mycena leptocephala]